MQNTRKIAHCDARAKCLYCVASVLSKKRKQRLSRDIYKNVFLDGGPFEWSKRGSLPFLLLLKFVPVQFDPWPLRSCRDEKGNGLFSSL